MSPLKSLEKIKSELNETKKIDDRATRGVKIAALISEALKSINIDPILVGGSAVAFYTEGKYTTDDIDMVAPSGPEVQKIMSLLGLKKTGKDFINEDLGIYIEFPSEFLGPTEKTNTISIKNSELTIISIEDLIIDRLASFKFWQSTIDGVNALMMLELGIANKERVEKRAREEDVLDALDYIENTLETIIRKKLSVDEATEKLNRYHKR